jgi:hypothetical protein
VVAAYTRAAPGTAEHFRPPSAPFIGLWLKTAQISIQIALNLALKALAEGPGMRPEQSAGWSNNRDGDDRLKWT